MKRMLFMSLALVVLGSSLFTSCSNVEEAQVTLQEQMINDQVFADAAITTLDLFLTAQENDWQSHSAEITAMMRKAQTEGLNAAEESQLTDLLGMTREVFIQQMTDFGTSLDILMTKYPVLQDMSAAERQALFTEVAAGNEELAAHLADLQSVLRACPLQDICNLVVDLAVVIGGPILCDIIAGAIPVIGPLLCNIAIDLATDILRGICNGLPC